MLPKKERLDRKNIGEFFSNKPSFHKGKILTLRARKNKNEVIRWAFIVSSSIKKNAVARNKVRRRMNNIAEDIKSSIHKGIDLVFIIKLNTKQPPSFKVLKNDMIHILKSCGAL